jgi:DNA-binding IscR family transcriptional regulator
VCLSRGIWERVQLAILSVLDSTTLEDLLRTEVLHHAAPHFVPLDTLRSELAHA